VIPIFPPNKKIERTFMTPETNESSAPVKAKVVTKDELFGRLQRGESIQLVNVLPPAQHTLGFIKGSRCIPLAELLDRLIEINPSMPVVTYCSGAGSNSALRAAEKLAAKGFDASAYTGGIKEWKAACLPLQNRPSIYYTGHS
jgi:rhodanese-related sulfurtransferase